MSAALAVVVATAKPRARLLSIILDELHIKVS